MQKDSIYHCSIPLQLLLGQHINFKRIKKIHLKHSTPLSLQYSTFGKAMGLA